MLQALNALAEAAPGWLKGVAPPEWFERYGTRFTSFRLPRTKEKREALAETVGADGWHLLALLYVGAAPERLLPAVDALRRVWPRAVRL